MSEAFTFDLNSFKGSPEFEGVIVRAEVETNDREPQLALTIRPFGVAMKEGSEGYRLWLKMSGSRKGLLYRWLTALKEKANFELKGSDPSPLVGVKATWARRDIKFGTDKDGNDIVKEDVIMPVGPYRGKTPIDPESMPIPQVSLAGNGGGVATMTRTATLAWTEEQIQLATSFLGGMPVTEVIAKAAIEMSTNPDFAVVGRAIIEGKLPEFLLKSGKLTIADGTYVYP